MECFEKDMGPICESSAPMTYHLSKTPTPNTHTSDGEFPGHTSILSVSYTGQNLWELGGQSFDAACAGDRIQGSSGNEPGLERCHLHRKREKKSTEMGPKCINHVSLGIWPGHWEEGCWEAGELALVVKS